MRGGSSARASPRLWPSSPWWPWRSSQRETRPRREARTGCAEMAFRVRVPFMDSRDNPSPQKDQVAKDDRAAPEAAISRPAPKSASSPLKVKPHLRAGDHLFDSQNNANGFWDEDAEYGN